MNARDAVLQMRWAMPCRCTGRLPDLWITTCLRAREFGRNPWVGFKHFEAFFNAPEFERLIRNTLVISRDERKYGAAGPLKRS